jgi:hypothetical protein
MEKECFQTIGCRVGFGGKNRFLEHFIKKQGVFFTNPFVFCLNLQKE